VLSSSKATVGTALGRGLQFLAPKQTEMPPLWCWLGHPAFNGATATPAHTAFPLGLVTPS